MALRRLAQVDGRNGECLPVLGNGTPRDNDALFPQDVGNPAVGQRRFRVLGAHQLLDQRADRRRRGGAAAGVGLGGRTTDKSVTFFCFGVIALFMILPIVLSLIQAKLDGRKEKMREQIEAMRDVPPPAENSAMSTPSTSSARRASSRVAAACSRPGSGRPCSRRWWPPSPRR